MFDIPMIAVAVILLLFSFGEYLSIVSRARIPMLFVVTFGYLILVWTGVFPTDIFDKAQLTAFASLMPAPLIVHMGTIIPFEQLKQQWKTVLIALTGIVLAAIFIIIVGMPIIGYTASVSGIGPLTGGTLAFIITSERLQEVGLATLITIPAIIMAIQGVVGMPLATNLLRKYGMKLQDSKAKSTHRQIAATIIHQNKDLTRKKMIVPEKYQTQIVLLTQAFVGGAVAIFLGEITPINYSLWALAIGITGSYFGLFKGDLMERANAFGLAMSMLIVMILSLMDTITFSLFLNYLPHALLILGVGTIGILLGGYIMSKIFKWDVHLGMPIALTALLGFPADYIVCEEVSRSIGRDQKERDLIFDSILTPMLVGGFTTVTVASIVIASILIGTI